MNRLKIAMASDVVSPFCWMACLQVEQAIAQFPEVEFELSLLPFQVTPDLPLDYTFEQYQREHMTRTFGSMDGVRNILSQITSMGRECGCEFHMELVTAWPNSRRAHGLWAMAANEKQRWQIHKALCQAHFQHGENLNEISTLSYIGERFGLDPVRAAEQLSDDSYIRDVLRDVSRTRALGIHSVPTLILNDRHRIQGATGRQELAATIRNILSDGESA